MTTEQCAFCGLKKITGRIKVGLETLIPFVMGAAEVTVKLPSPVICHDCVKRLHSEIEAEENADVDLPIGRNRILFREGRWWFYDTDKDSIHEMTRSEARGTLIDCGIKDKVSKKAWADVLLPDQPLLPIE